MFWKKLTSFPLLKANFQKLWCIIQTERVQYWKFHKNSGSITNNFQIHKKYEIILKQMRMQPGWGHDGFNHVKYNTRLPQSNLKFLKS